MSADFKRVQEGIKTVEERAASLSDETNDLVAKSNEENDHIANDQAGDHIPNKKRKALSKCKYFFSRLLRGVTNVVIFPISVVFALPKLYKIYKDPEIRRLKHNASDKKDQEAISKKLILHYRIYPKYLSLTKHSGIALVSFLGIGFLAILPFSHYQMMKFIGGFPAGAVDLSLLAFLSTQYLCHLTFPIIAVYGPPALVGYIAYKMMDPDTFDCALQHVLSCLQTKHLKYFQRKTIQCEIDSLKRSENADALKIIQLLQEEFPNNNEMAQLSSFIMKNTALSSSLSPIVVDYLSKEEEPLLYLLKRSENPDTMKVVKGLRDEFSNHNAIAEGIDTLLTAFIVNSTTLVPALSRIVVDYLPKEPLLYSFSSCFNSSELQERLLLTKPRMLEHKGT